MFSKINAIYKKEMLSLLRDKKALLTIFLPVLIYPVLLIMLFGAMNIVETSTQDLKLTFTVDIATSNDLLALMEKDERLVIELRDDLNTLAFEGTADFERTHAYLLRHDQNGIEGYRLFYHSNYDDSMRLQRLASTLLSEYSKGRHQSLLLSYDLVDVYESIVQIAHEEVSGEGDGRFISMIMGMIFPFLIVLYGIAGTNIISSDLSAGEKERATLETIFSVPIQRFEIITGKLFACSTVGILSGGINILALFPLIFALSMNFPDVNVTISLQLLAYLMLLLVPIMVLCSAVFIGIGMFAKTYQESQSYASIALIGLMALCYIFLIPDIEPNAVLYSVPITNALFLMREAFLGSYHFIETLQVLSVNTILSALCVWFMHSVFKYDWVIFGGDGQ
jgi:sodium transport system permease protein